MLKQKKLKEKIIKQKLKQYILLYLKTNQKLRVWDADLEHELMLLMSQLHQFYVQFFNKNTLILFVFT